MQNLITEKKYFFLCCLFFFCFGLGFGQTIVIGTPTLGFSQACASESFNTYNVSFTVTPVSNLQAGNEFRIELSNGSGSFANPVVVKTVTSTTSPVTTSFNLPTNTSGEAYKIRVRSTAPAVLSPSSVSFAAHYAAHNQAFSINNNVGTVTFCDSGSYTLQVDNNGTSSSPLFYPNLVYKWYKNFAVVSGATTSSLVVTQSGNYYAIVDYGSCVMNSYSNIVTIAVTPGINLTINTSDNSDFICDQTSKTLVSSHQNSGYTYQWFKNDIAISGATAATYNATTQGNYKLKITSGNCVFESNIKFLELIQLSLDLNVSSTEILIPGQQIQVTSINNAINPSIQWKKDGVNIPSATTANLTITQPGVYSITVRETSGCTSLVKTETVTVQYPTGFVVTIQNMPSYQSCVSTTTTLSIASFIAQTPNGNISVSSNSSITWQWFKNDVAIDGATNSSLIISNSTLNGNYKIKANITSFSPVSSNVIAVALKLPVPVLTSQGNLCNGGTVSLSSSVINDNYTYKWYKNTTLITGANLPTYATTVAGNYYVTVSSMNCLETSNAIDLQLNSITVAINSPASTVLIPGETKTLTATTSATQGTYQWYKNNVIISGQTSSSLTINEIGTYKVIVSQNSGCIATQEASITIVSPSNYVVVIGKETGYQDCESRQTVLKIISFDAVTPSGNVSILNNTNGFTFEWYKNGTIVNSATSNTYSISSNSGNGSYLLKVNTSNSNVVSSNATIVNLGLSETFTVTKEGYLCETGGNIMLSTSTTNPLYAISWFKSGSTTVLGTNTTLNVTNLGDYYYKVTNATCTYTSQTISLSLTDASAFSLNIPEELTVFQGSSHEVIATGAESYTWSLNNQLISSNSSLMVSEAGTYKVIGTIGTCEFVKTFIVIMVENTSVVIPNLVTLNGDGKNDFWAIPSEYVNQEEITVALYASNGRLVFKTNNYQNNWPNENFEYSSKESVLYYIITKNEDVLKKGSITIIK